MFGWIRRTVSSLRGRIRWIRTPEAIKRMIVAHEAGHALAAWHLSVVIDVLEVSILPHGPFGGFTLTSHRSDDLTIEDVFELLVMRMAGMAGERLLLGQAGLGGRLDLLIVIAQWLTLEYGMSQSAAQVIAAETIDSLDSPDDARRTRAEDVAATASAAFYAAAEILLKRRLETLVRLTQALRRRKVLKSRHLHRLLGPRTHESIQELFQAALVTE